MKITILRAVFIAQVFLAMAIYATPAQAQTKKKQTNNASSGVNSGVWGIGIRAGDPTGLTIKKYGSKAAVELNLGRSYYLYKYNYESAFYRYPKYKNTAIYRYDKYDPYAPICIQLHILKHMPIKELDGLSWYLGAGPQFRNERVHYWYYYKDPVTEKWVYTDENYNDFDLGVDVTGGIEYTVKEIPVSVFLDATMFMEIIDEPFWLWGQGGAGIRYNFNK